MALLEQEVLRKVNRKVYQRFPAVKGVKPSVRRAEGNRDLIHLTYTTRAQTADGFSLTQRVQVLVTPTGKIVKMTTVR